MGYTNCINRSQIAALSDVTFIILSAAISTIKPIFGPIDDQADSGSGLSGFISNFAEHFADGDKVTTTTTESSSGKRPKNFTDADFREVTSESLVKPFKGRPLKNNYSFKLP